MREQVSRQKKTTTGFSIPSLKQPIHGFGLESSAISRQAIPQIQPLHKPVTHDISRIPLRSPQAKLSISQPGDRYEQEADSVAQQVMQRMAQPVNRQSIQPEALPEDEELQMKPLANSIMSLQREVLPEDEEELQMKSLDNSTLQREVLPEDEEELQMKSMVQRQAGIATAPDLEASINQARGGGVAMADNIREPMEQAFGADFSGVKVHTDDRSDQLNRSIQARAFTTGQDVFFKQGEYNPRSQVGQELLAHELTHVVQQNGAVQRSASNSVDSAPFGIQNQPFEKTISRELVSENDEKIQRKPTVMRGRDHLGDDRQLPGMRVPDMEMQQYAEHVQTRVVLFFSVTSKALRQILGTGRQVPPKLFHPHAMAQIGSGYRGDKEQETVKGELRYDAAHYMNTTLNQQTYASAMGIPIDSHEVQDLYSLTAATSNQFQTSNVSSDKVIDSLQTEYVNKMIALCNQEGAWRDDRIKEAVVAFLIDGKNRLYTQANALLHSGNVEDNQLKTSSYFAAAGAMAHMLGEIDQTLEKILQELG
ncbi:DUF4157 domain-containing protein [Nostoc sp. PA-18-2419]|uniref:eCIS core domain-containing protein n=1 Tax=Nostoc sp. PA-18-2419 TaxID=2575443 RepID=UPI001CB92DB0|nr:DUF4157 domain-containing protein [Nostoc sp. PA-18-2419]